MVTREKVEMTASEREVMRVVWTLGNATSKDIVDVLERKRDWKPATAKTFIGRLVKKGILFAEPHGNKYIYTAAISEEDSVKTAAERFFEQICHKQAGKTIADMLAGATLSHQDVELLQSVLDDKKKHSVDKVACNCVPGQCNCSTQR
ncbi:CopY/TcrY family copper transport repressor [Planococcus sp. ISL-110]|uniref:CopY/TcrY family copper transport repressor n=1 Tax=Planococcus sp. ISL-110 TaxID=2819167 RepID=UPI001BEB5037|nr:CopY/TcrY family copper transport repressor [Planococcus sp. ISL-110]MBT2569075.1 CopY/TcrY family copper transport repressor [Planococcus sp. ISL-110]